MAAIHVYGGIRRDRLLAGSVNLVFCVAVESALYYCPIRQSVTDLVQIGWFPTFVMQSSVQNLGCVERVGPAMCFPSKIKSWHQLS